MPMGLLSLQLSAGEKREVAQLPFARLISVVFHLGGTRVAITQVWGFDSSVCTHPAEKNLPSFEHTW